MSIPDDCPICKPGTCKGYPHLWQKLREEPWRWYEFHAKINGYEVKKASDFSLQYPSFATMAKNAVVAAGSVVASIVKGEPVTVSQEEQDRRLAICHVCEKFDRTQGRCTLCGCFGKWKTWIASQKCPIDKW